MTTGIPATMTSPLGKKLHNAFEKRQSKRLGGAPCSPNLTQDMVQSKGQTITRMMGSNIRGELGGLRSWR